MIYLLRLILFWFSYIGIIRFVKDRLKIECDFSLGITTLLLIIILFLASILNILKLVSFALFILGILYNIIFAFKQLKNKHKIQLNYKIIFIVVFFIYLTFIATQFKFSGYDNFSHWALMAKQLFTYDALPSFEYGLVDFTTYPPASSLFIYYVGLIAGRVETSMIIGQLYLTFIFLTPLMAFFKEKTKKSNVVLFSLLTLFILNCNIALMDLMVDTLLGSLGIFSCCIAYYYRNDLKKVFLYLTLTSSIFMILKNSGVLFIAFNVILLFIVGVYNKKIKKSILYGTLLLLIAFSFFVLWQQHLKMVYPGETGVTTKHSISLANFRRTISKNGIEQTKKVGMKYLSSFANVKDNIILYYLGAINILIIIMMFVSKKYKELLRTLLFIDLMYVGYWACLGIMYILSMPYEEAIRLASYSRYMMSCIIIFFGIIGIITFELNSNKNKLYNITLCCFILSSIYFNPFSNYQYFYRGNDHSEIDEIEKIVEKYPIDEFKENNVYLYLDCEFTSYYHWLLRYKYFQNNVSVKCGTTDTTALESEAIAIVPFYAEQVEQNNKNLVKIRENIFKVKVEENEV